LSVLIDYLPWFLGLLTILVFVHELGHYLAARVVGVHAETFSIGFGPEILGFKDGRGCRWRLAMIPLGGYVKMRGDANATSFGQNSELVIPGSLASASIGARALIFIAGPLANFILTGVVAALMYMTIGQSITPPIIGAVTPGGAAAIAGLEAGDRIVAINNHKVRSFEDVRDAELMGGARPLSFEIERDSKLLKLIAQPQIRELKDRFGNIYEHGDLGFHHQIPVRLGKVEVGGPAFIGGLRVGDQILSVDGVGIRDFGLFADYVRQRPNKSIEMLVDRAGSTIRVSVIPASVKRGENFTGRIGVAVAPFTPISLGLGPALFEGTVFVWEKSGLILDYLWQIVAGIRPVDEIGGVIRIAQLAGDTAAISFTALLGFGMMLSLNLGLINLFPIPMLDGGHLFFLAIEWARGRRLSERAEEFGFRLGFAIVIGVMLFATWNDLMHFQVFERLKTWIG
jgi:regulator of sigma E protease